MICVFKRAYQVSDEGGSPPEPSECYQFTLVSHFEENIVFTYKPCGEEETTISLNNEEETVCAEYVTPPPYPTNKWDIFLGDECGA